MTHPTQPIPAAPRRRRRPGGFTMTELIVVMGIIILFIALAIPAVNAMMGTRSIAAAENTLSSLLARVRQEALAAQDYRGVLFTIDPATDRVVATVVMPAAFQDITPLAGASPVNSRGEVLLLDTVPDDEHMVFPVGIRIQTAFDCVDPTTQLPYTDRYLGFNVAPMTSQQSMPVKSGGVILFDGNGQLAVRPYGFQCLTTNSVGANTLSGMGDLLKYNGGSVDRTQTEFIPFCAPGAQPVPQAPKSQIALILYDKKTFDTQGFTEANTGLDDTTGSRTQHKVFDETGSVAEDDWLDNHGTPIMINRYTGILIRGE